LKSDRIITPFPACHSYDWRFISANHSAVAPQQM
jgi:hypothetical protein